MRIRASLVAVSSVLLLASAVPSARAGGPVHEGPFARSYDEIGFSCDGFDIRIQGSGTDAFMTFFDDAGNLTKVIYRARAPRDTLTNTVTGRSIVVRAHFQEVLEWIPGTDQVTKTITGFRYMVNEPGVGVTIRDVGRITYGDLEQTLVLWEAGEHDLALDAAFEPTFCAALA